MVYEGINNKFINITLLTSYFAIEKGKRNPILENSFTIKDGEFVIAMVLQPKKGVFILIKLLRIDGPDSRETRILP